MAMDFGATVKASSAVMPKRDLSYVSTHLFCMNRKPASAIRALMVTRSGGRMPPVQAVLTWPY